MHSATGRLGHKLVLASLLPAALLVPLSVARAQPGSEPDLCSKGDVDCDVRHAPCSLIDVVGPIDQNPGLAPPTCAADVPSDAAATASS